MKKKLLLTGISGLVANATARRFLQDEEWEIVGTARRAPEGLDGVSFFPADLTNEQDCAEKFGAMTDITHLIYTAVYEKPSVRSGWLDQEQIDTNDRMLRNCLEPLKKAAPNLEQVIILQGGKAYGSHVSAAPISVREHQTRRDIPNFYWVQEDYLKKAAQGQNWNWTILRPQIVFGQAVGNPLNFLAAIGVYGAILRERGEPLYIPGVSANILQAADSDLLAKALFWASTDPAADNEIFNIHNGDSYTWPQVWPVIAEALGMEPGPWKQMVLAEEMPALAGEWDQIRQKYGLAAPDMHSFVGNSFSFADFCLATRCDDPNRVFPPAISSNVKAQQAGFTQAVHTEDMLVSWLKRMQDQKLLPPV